MAEEGGSGGDGRGGGQWRGAVEGMTEEEGGEQERRQGGRREVSTIRRLLTRPDSHVLSQAHSLTCSLPHMLTPPLTPSQAHSLT